jgi:hypothetical protein
MRKSIFTVALAFLSILVFTGICFAQCVTIQDGILTDSKGNPITLGYDDWGYNYQAHMFNGFYDNYNRPDTPVTSGDELIMKWNDAWMSNKNCSSGATLDRHFGNTSYKGSGAWLTNHQSGWVTDLKGKQRKYTYFCKIVAVPEDAFLGPKTLEGYTEGTWYTDASQTIVIGPCIWGEFAVTEEVYNDPSANAHGRLYKFPLGPGLGLY